MTKTITLTTIIALFLLINVNAQDTTKYKLRLVAPLLDAPENFNLPHKYPSMDQALEFSSDFYELGFWGIDEVGNKLFKDPYGDKFYNNAFKYLLGLAFSKYGSELPIPLGVWAHEEYHRAVLGKADIASENGNWLFTRWDGTVFGVSDTTLSILKRRDPGQLLYAYTSGVQYEANLSQQISIRDFYNQRSHYKNALLLYNAYYIYDYFNFSASEKSDSVKVLAPPDESKNPMERDFAGADLTAWVYDMFNPDMPFNNRDDFPGGEGVNRRIGFSDLSAEARDYLEKQRSLSLLNFVNPAIFFINRIKVTDDFSFNFFTQYVPTHFGNDIALYIPFTYRNSNLLVNFHKYSNKDDSGLGLGLGIYNFKVTDRFESDLAINYWDQPKSFYSDDKISGGFVNFESRYSISQKFSAFLAFDVKTKGWMIGEPDLYEDYSIQAGINFNYSRKQKK